MLAKKENVISGGIWFSGIIKPIKLDFYPGRVEVAANHLEIICPCCESKLRVDHKTGEVIWMDEKKKELESLSDMVKELDAQRKEKESLFKKQSELQKERSRLLDEKFKESQKHVDKSDDSKPLRDIDFD